MQPLVSINNHTLSWLETLKSITSLKCRICHKPSFITTVHISKKIYISICILSPTLLQKPKVCYIWEPQKININDVSEGQKMLLHGVHDSSM